MLQTRYFVGITDPYPDILCYRIDHRYSAQNDEFEWLLSQRIISWYVDASDQKVPHELELGLGLGPELSFPPWDIVSMGSVTRVGVRVRR